MKINSTSSLKKTKTKRNTEGEISLRQQREMLCDKLNFAGSEAYKMLRNNILFSLPDENKCRIIGVTSSIRGEGKSTTSINMSYTLAETGKSVLLIDADMRLPSVAKKLATASRPGLSNLLVGMNSTKECVHASGLLDSWFIMPAGNLPPNPSELLGSEQMEKAIEGLSKDFDFIVIDLPPVTIVSDALTVSRVLDGMVLTVRQDYTDRQSLNECMRQMNFLNTKLLGFVMTDASNPTKGYGKYGKYGKYGYESYGASGQNTKSAVEHHEKKLQPEIRETQKVTTTSSQPVMDTIAKTVSGAMKKDSSERGQRMSK